MFDSILLFDYFGPLGMIRLNLSAWTAEGGAPRETKGENSLKRGTGFEVLE